MPASQIFQKVASMGIWPKRWRTERGISLKKVPEPTSEQELRIISLTPFLSKTFEQITLDWLLPYISDKIDWNQYGGIRGTSVSHYLIELITFILYNQDLNEPRAVLAAMVDFEKAFNRQNHAKLITKLADWGVPAWLLKIVIGFLTERELVVVYKGEESESKSMPGGGPQGTIVGMILFLVLINDAGYDKESVNIGEKITKSVNKRNEMKAKHFKYVDDMTLAEAIILKDTLVPKNDNELIGPLNFHDRFELSLPDNENKLQEAINKLKAYTVENEMKINKKKTKVMLFNQAIKYDFMPEIKLDDGESAEVVEEFKLLGVFITIDLKWHKNTKHITTKGFQRLWMLRRLRQLGASQSELIDVYVKQVRSILEFASVVWHPGLTQDNTAQIERVQKSAFAIIIGKDDNSYKNSLQIMNMETLKSRREELSVKFAKKAAEHQRHITWFEPQTETVNTRLVKVPYMPVNFRTDRFKNSFLPNLASFLNKTNR